MFDVLIKLKSSPKYGIICHAQTNAWLDFLLKVDESSGFVRRKRYADIYALLDKRD